MSARYVVVGGWDVYEQSQHHDVTIEVADLYDTRTGTTYSGGARRVKGGGLRARTFKGETAWCKADADAYYRIRHAGL